MSKVLAGLVYAAYALAGVVLAVGTPKLGFTAYAGICMGLGLSATCIIMHLFQMASRRASRLSALLDCQDEVLQQIVARLTAAEDRADAVSTRLDAMGDVKATLQDVAAMLAVRAAVGRPVLARAA